MQEVFDLIKPAIHLFLAAPMPTSHIDILDLDLVGGFFVCIIDGSKNHLAITFLDYWVMCAKLFVDLGENSESGDI